MIVKVLYEKRRNKLKHAVGARGYVMPRSRILAVRISCVIGARRKPDVMPQPSERRIFQTLK